MIRTEQLHPSGPMGSHTLLYLLDALLCLPLRGQGPATPYGGRCPKSRKPLLVRQYAQGFGLLLNGLGLVQELLELGIQDPAHSRGKRVSDLLSQAQRVAIPRPRLLWIAKQPQDLSQTGESRDTQISANASNGSVPLLRVVQGKGVLKVGAS